MKDFMNKNIYEAVEEAITKHGLCKDTKERNRIELFRSSKWPKGTVVGSPEHTKVLQALADKHGAKFRNFSESTFDHMCRFTWGSVQ